MKEQKKKRLKTKREWVAYHAVAERTVMLSKDVSFSSCSEIGRSHEISWMNSGWRSIKDESERERERDNQKNVNNKSSVQWTRKWKPKQ